MHRLPGLQSPAPAQILARRELGRDLLHQVEEIAKLQRSQKGQPFFRRLKVPFRFMNLPPLMLPVVLKPVSLLTFTKGLMRVETDIL